MAYLLRTLRPLLYTWLLSLSGAYKLDLRELDAQAAQRA